MKEVKVTASNPYSVLIGAGIMKDFKALCSDIISDKKLAVITDDTVDELYFDKLGLNGALKFVFPHGEESKNMNTLSDILEFLADNNFTRSDVLIALGGGVVGDITGFAAAVYMRGINYIQVPTTLLAMVDSSVGGKCAVDLHHGKNLAGAFHQPKRVICDTSALQTLPDEMYKAGMAEVIKYGVLSGINLDSDIETLVFDCVSVKADIVRADEFDNGARQLLNLGHTPAHGIEALSSYTVPHGFAVAAGMGMIARASVKNGFCSNETADKVIGILKENGLPCDTEYNYEKIAEVAMRDKKAKGDKLTLVLIEKYGKCILHEINKKDFADFISVK